ncbi:hypothetical protein ACH35V_00435 [Actinomadura sp. 1N219]|uniref:hypothetical protein n=1 Tax=Actinomadura sp. 1N219 TaxID=3375152 RepID=UPI00379C998D
MSFDKGRHAATVDAPPRNERREYLSALHEGVRAHPELAGGLIERRGVSWVSVVRYGGPRRTAEIGCDFRDGGWWFCWAADGRAIAPASDITRALDAITRELAEVDGHSPRFRAPGRQARIRGGGSDDEARAVGGHRDHHH